MILHQQTLLEVILLLIRPVVCLSLLNAAIFVQCIQLVRYLTQVVQFIKGIVSRDWGGLQMILLDRLEVFNVSASNLFLVVSAFSYRIFKNAQLSRASFQHIAL